MEGDAGRYTGRIEACGGQHPAVCQLADAWLVAEENYGRGTGADGASASVGGMLCAGRAVSAAVDVADDGDSGAGRGRGAHRGGNAEPAASDAGGRIFAGHHRVVSLRWSAG